MDVGYATSCNCPTNTKVEMNSLTTELSDFYNMPNHLANKFLDV